MILFSIPVMSNLFQQKITLRLFMVNPVSGCNGFFPAKDEYSQSTVLLNLGTTGVLHAYWLTDGDEINFFGHSLILDAIEAVRSHKSILVQYPGLVARNINPKYGVSLFWFWLH